MMPILRVEPTDPGPLLVIVPSIFGIGTDVVEYMLAFASEGALVYVLIPFGETLLKDPFQSQWEHHKR